jgi:hypothetical protein
VGADGTVVATLGVALLEGADAGPVNGTPGGAGWAPALVAVTVKVWAVPLTNGDTTMGEPVPVGPATQTGPGRVQDVTWKLVIAAPPLLAGGVNDTVASASPPIALTAVGAPGGPAGVAALVAPDPGLAPTALFAVTVKV